MDDIKRGVLAIIGSALTGKKAELPEDFDFSKSVSIAKKHKIEVMFYYGALNCGFDKTDPLMKNLFLLVCQNIVISERQMCSMKEICSAFDEQGIDYLPLKGAVLKNIYPKPEMRSMGDADILIKTEQYSAIKPIMQKLEYKEITESDHEFIWNKLNVYIELHKRLIPSYNRDYYAYFGDGWELAKPERGTRYSMNDENQMIYLFTHFAKHYRDAGIGIKHIVDLWVYRKSKPNLDEDYIKNELKTLQLYDFYQNIMNTLSVWFDGGKSDEKTDFITDVIFNSGTYGKSTAHALSSGVKLSKSTEHVKAKRLFSLIFLPYKTMCMKYPLLKKAPFLLPLFWIVRIFTVLIFKRHKIKRHKQQLDYMTKENIKNYNNALNFVGLDYNFKE